jgi:hypothetical protein
MSFRWWFSWALACLLTPISLGQTAAQDESYLHWSLQQADAVAKSTYQDGKVGSRVLWALTGIDTRVLKTERAQNYKLRATWFTPEVIRASARAAQLRSRLRDDETRTLVADADGAGDTVIMIEIDPNEGSGVIPPDWESFLQPGGTVSSDASVRGTENSELRKIRALQGVQHRNYDYDRFWVVFPLVNDQGHATISTGTTEVELVVRIYNREGKIRWTVPASVRTRIQDLQAKHTVKSTPSN